MIIRGPHINLLDLVSCFSEALDLISPAVANHHKQVAYIAYSLARELNLSENQGKTVALAAGLHDVGALSLEERLESLQFDDHEFQPHAELGYHFLKDFKAIGNAASMIRYHHLHWDQGQGLQYNGEEVPIGSHIIHLADRIAVSIEKDQEILQQSPDIIKTITAHTGTMFNPEHVEAFIKLANFEFFWLDIVSPSLGAIITRPLHYQSLEMDLAEMEQFAQFFAHMIDLRSPLNAYHSKGVAVSAEFIANKLGFSKLECQMLKIAGYLHDLGKLAVPLYILEKPTQLTKNEFSIIKGHAYYTYRILSNISQADVITAWASLHHECLDGSGYPFHIREKDLPLGSQIMAVADVLTAICEDRPYRIGMDKKSALQVLDSQVKEKRINGDLVAIPHKYYEEIDHLRVRAQSESTLFYKKIGTANEKL